MVRFERRGNVFVLRLDAGENRFTPAVLHALREGLEQVESAGSPAALVTTGTGKFYSNGLDLDHMGSLGSGGASDYLTEVLAVLARILTFPATTVAAVNGHAFGAGALMAIAHDFQVMRADRGFFCMPEVDMRVPLHPGMTALLQARLPVRTVHRVIATGKRFGGEEAVAAGIVDRAVAEDEVLPAAVAMAEELASKADPALTTLKRGMYPQVLEAVAKRLDSLSL